VRNRASLAALTFAIFANMVAIPYETRAMTIASPAGLSSAAAAAEEPERIQWCGRRGCLRPHYWEPHPSYWQYYRRWPYYGYFFGSGWPSYGWYR
jgi:hypothetical protein